MDVESGRNITAQHAECGCSIGVVFDNLVRVEAI